MCRLAAYVGDPIAPATLVFSGEHSLERQSWAPREMLSGTVNVDGIGVVWYDDLEAIRFASDRPVWHEAAHRPLLSSVRSRVVAAAVRNGTEGLTIDRASVPPLIHGRWSFTLNGYVERFRPEFMRDFRQELSDELYGEILGSTDTETLFLLLRHRLELGMTPVDALRDLCTWVVDRVKAKGRKAQLGILLTNGVGIWATRAGSLPASNSLYVHRNWDALPRGTTLASEPFDASDGWELLADQSIVEVQEGGSVRVVEL